MILKRLWKILKRLWNMYVVPKDEAETAGYLHYVSPKGKMEVKATITTLEEEREVKKIVDILLAQKSQVSISIEDCGLTD